MIDDLARTHFLVFNVFNTIYILIDRYMPITMQDENGTLEDSCMFIRKDNTIVTHFVHAALISDRLLRAGYTISYGAPPVFSIPRLDLRIRPEMEIN